MQDDKLDGVNLSALNGITHNRQYGQSFCEPDAGSPVIQTFSIGYKSGDKDDPMYVDVRNLHPEFLKISDHLNAGINGEFTLRNYDISAGPAFTVGDGNTNATLNLGIGYRKEEPSVRYDYGTTPPPFNSGPLANTEYPITVKGMILDPNLSFESGRFNLQADAKIPLSGGYSKTENLQGFDSYSQSTSSLSPIFDGRIGYSVTDPASSTPIRVTAGVNFQPKTEHAEKDVGLDGVVYHGDADIVKQPVSFSVGIQVGIGKHGK